MSYCRLSFVGCPLSVVGSVVGVSLVGCRVVGGCVSWSVVYGVPKSPTPRDIKKTREGLRALGFRNKRGATCTRLSCTISALTSQVPGVLLFCAISALL